MTNQNRNRMLPKKICVIGTSLKDQINADYNKGLTELSMGMSNDYELAVEEGSTMVRLGTALFGFRREYMKQKKQ